VQLEPLHTNSKIPLGPFHVSLGQDSLLDLASLDSVFRGRSAQAELRLLRVESVCLWLRSHLLLFCWARERAFGCMVGLQRASSPSDFLLWLFRVVVFRIERNVLSRGRRLV
jgi:hypothetical protein